MSNHIGYIPSILQAPPGYGLLKVGDKVPEGGLILCTGGWAEIHSGYIGFDLNAGSVVVCRPISPIKEGWRIVERGEELESEDLFYDISLKKWTKTYYPGTPNNGHEAIYYRKDSNP